MSDVKVTIGGKSITFDDLDRSCGGRFSLPRPIESGGPWYVKDAAPVSYLDSVLPPPPLKYQPDFVGSYMRKVYEGDYLTKAVDRVDWLLRNELKGRFDCLAFTGCSGAAVAYPLAALGYKVTCVRKRNEHRHSSHVVEGFVGRDARYLIVDEQVSGGGTVRTIIKEIAEASPTMRPVGLVLYMYPCESWPGINNLDVWNCTP